jgi:hypothetical protein
MVKEIQSAVSAGVMGMEKFSGSSPYRVGKNGLRSRVITRENSLF